MDRTEGRHLSIRPSQCGVSLIELMVGLALGLVIVLAVLQGYAASTMNAAVNMQVSEYQTNGRHALEILKRELRHAGLHPLLWDTQHLVVNPTAAAKDFGCGAGTTATVQAGLTGWNDTNPFAGTCLTDRADRRWARGDVLVIRRAALDASTTFDANAPYIRLAYGAGHVFLGGEAPADLVEPVADHRIVHDVYFVNAFTSSASESPRIPALYRLRLSEGANPTMKPELVASNIEHFQLQYAEAVAANGTMQYRNANQISDWANVKSVRIWLLLRASNPEGTLSGEAAQSYPFGDVTYAPTDNFRRRLLTSTISLRNP
ncbi:PilW family protein [Sphaerotilus microaerophilus]|uniref:Type IV pilus assembly protein PilW n=1 Tax=Sphaerotilus microaerophilus TaxID=2914710 RepID=A0ABM9GNM6_9BURK|nr:PilW family protein [Sphaerotilus sp. FB-5]BDI08055.1 hypothetical protein CATMQ487_50250 [Sphaerotilus sp. FB-5]